MAFSCAMLVKYLNVTKLLSKLLLAFKCTEVCLFLCLVLSLRELADLHKANATKDSEAQEAALSREMKAKEELGLALEKAQEEARQQQEALAIQVGLKCSNKLCNSTGDCTELLCTPDVMDQVELVFVYLANTQRISSLWNLFHIRGGCANL